MKRKVRANRWPTGRCPPAVELRPAGRRNGYRSDSRDHLWVSSGPFFGERRVGFDDQPAGSYLDERRRCNRCGLPARFG